MAARREKYSGTDINYTLAPDDVLLQCPYDKVHKILQPRMPFHLVKCRENYRKAMARKGQPVDMAICRFNYAHQFPAMEIAYHEMNCSSAGHVVDHMVKLTNPEGFKVNVVSNNDEDGDVKPHMVDTEDWDAEVKSKSGPKGYDPSLKLNKEAGRIIQTLPGVSTVSERKKFREEQAEVFRQRGDFADAPFHDI